MPQEIIDSHIHLYEAQHIPRLAWTSELPLDHPLNRENSIIQYREASSNVRGIVFVETDRKSGLSESDWEDALQEVDFVDSLKAPVLGIVAWAPLPAGAEALSKYMA